MARTLLVTVLMVCACGAPTRPSSTAEPRPSIADTALALLDHPPAPGEILVLAETPGAVTPMRTVDGGTEPVADLTVLQRAGEGIDAPALLPGGASADLAGTGIMIFDGDSELEWGVEHTWVLVATIVSCGDYCHSQVMLLGVGPDGEHRVPLGVTVQHDLVWRADGGALAVVLDGELVDVALPAGLIRLRADGLESPSYAPDGSLYARRTDDGAYVRAHDGDVEVIHEAGADERASYEQASREMEELPIGPEWSETEFGPDGAPLFEAWRAK